MLENNVYSLKKRILNMSNDCGYILSKSNEPFKNITRIESMKGYHEQIKANNNIDSSTALLIDNWIDKLSKKYK
ncbi:hypothetical protein Q5N48_17350 [Vibrio cholerae]|uniref:hypothetical protein n=1 Tax=Vibrio cholerae TaxID=666 RepID=UPI002934DE72|nr:hypothetical protein [Vibrio cholerae]MDV2358392.1 hypothetical protein [Vibrio cholerae]